MLAKFFDGADRHPGAMRPNEAGSVEDGLARCDVDAGARPADVELVMMYVVEIVELVVEIGPGGMADWQVVGEIEVERGAVGVVANGQSGQAGGAEAGRMVMVGNPGAALLFVLSPVMDVGRPRIGGVHP